MGESGASRAPACAHTTAHYAVVHQVGRGARQEARPAEAEDAFQRAEALVTEWGAAHAREVALRAHMYQCMGEHAKAVALISRALEAGLGPAPIECLFLRGARKLHCM